MSKIIIKLNENDNYLSLGNIFRIIKSLSIDPNSFLQTDLFSIIFNCDVVANSTVNNYCTGQRAINSKYKNYILMKKKNYESNKSIFLEEISKILTLINTGILSDTIYTIKYINNDSKLKHICSKLYTISKNDSNVDINLSNRLLTNLTNNNLYEFFIDSLLFAILDRSQPVYKNNILSDIIEKNIIDTNISVNDVEKFIGLQLKEGIWSIRGIYELAKQNNPFACFEMASLEFYGIVFGKPRYDKAYSYYKIASENNHPVASWAIGFLYYNGYVGNRNSKDLQIAYDYFISSAKSNCPSAFNSLGLVYLNGDIPSIERNIDTAITYFKRAAELGNVYAFNNLGKISENNKNFTQAFEYYNAAANLGDSWALNKIGEFYRLGIGIEENYLEAFKHYELSSNCFNFSLCPWSKYNLAIHFYKYGIPEINIYPDINHAIALLEDIENDLIEALEELTYIYYDLYLKSQKEDSVIEQKIKSYICKIEKHPNYNSEIKKRIETKIQIAHTQNINIDKYL